MIEKTNKQVETIVAELPSTFSGTLDYHIKRKGYTNEKMEEVSLISSRMIQIYRNNPLARPSLQSTLALCVGLNLKPIFSYDLIAKTGYNIMNVTKGNLLYRYLIDNKYTEDIYIWNKKLRDAGMRQLPRNRKKLSKD